MSKKRAKHSNGEAIFRKKHRADDQFENLLKGAAGAVIHYVGYTPGLFVVGLFGILIMWMYGYFWITGMLLVAGGCMCSLKNARFVIPVLTIYADYCVAVRVGWLGVFLTLNLSFLTNDLLNKLLQGYEGSIEDRHFEESCEAYWVLDEQRLLVYEFMPRGSGSSCIELASEMLRVELRGRHQSNTNLSTVMLRLADHNDVGLARYGHDLATSRSFSIEDVNWKI